MSGPQLEQFLTPVAVEADGLLLREFRVEDAAVVAAVTDDPQLRLWNPMTVAAEQWCRDRADWSDGTHASWAITRPDDPGRLLGSVSLHQISATQLDSEIGYWLAPGARGHGIASAAVRIAARFGFQRVGLQRIALFHAVENVASCWVATAAGFLQEGTHRSSYRYGDGQWYDEHSHARLASDPPLRVLN